MNSETEQELILKSRVDLACTLKSNSTDLSISNIIFHNDKYNKKGIAVNNHLKKYFLHRSHEDRQTTESK